MNNKIRLLVSIWYYFIILSLSIISISCNFNTQEASAYLKYANDSTNGLIQSTFFYDIQINLKLIPSNYFYLKDNDLTALSLKSKKQLKLDYDNSLYFLLDIKPRVKRDKIIDRNTFNIQEFKRKTQGLNFHLEELLSITTAGRQYFPVLSSLQNVYELDGAKTILLAFSLEDKIQDDIVASFNDQIFTGETFKFNFKKEDINNIPNLKL